MINLPDELQHGNPLLAIMDSNNTRGGLKQISTFTNVALASAFTGLSDKFKIGTILVALDTNKLYKYIGSDPTSTSSYSEIASSSGTVTSVGLSMPSAFSVSSSPITSSGTISVSGTGSTSQVIRGDGTLGNSIGSIGITVDAGTNTITSGSKGFISCNYSGTITSYTILGNISGTIQVDLKKSNYSSFPSTTSITGTNYINLSASQKNSTSTLTSWTTSFSANDIFEFEVITTNTTLSKITIVLNTTKTL